MGTIYKNRNSERASLWAKKHPMRASENKRRWSNKHKEQNAECKYQYWSKNKLKIKGHILQVKYGIGINDYNRMFQIQGGMCAICSRHQSEFQKGLHVDHDHVTKRNRGLLCPVCNTKLHALENKEWRIKAEIYLGKYR